MELNLKAVPNVGEVIEFAVLHAEKMVDLGKRSSEFIKADKDNDGCPEYIVKSRKFLNNGTVVLYAESADKQYE